MLILEIEKKYKCRVKVIQWMHNHLPFHLKYYKEVRKYSNIKTQEEEDIILRKTNKTILKEKNKTINTIYTVCAINNLT